MLKTNFVPMTEALKIADARGIALGAFEFWSYEVARAIIEAAEELDVPVILQCGSTEINRMGGMRGAVETAYMASKDTTVPVVLHLDHAVTFEYCNEAINAGFSSVMIDASALPFEENVEVTRKVARRAKPFGVSVEGELGRLVGEEGDIIVKGPEAAQTDPDEALRYVAETGVDCLAVSIGTAHGQYTFEPKLNIPRLKQIREKLNMPIVLHGGSGTPLEQVQEAIRNGIRKVNICTDIQIAMGKAYTEVQSKPGFKYTAENLWGPGQAAAKELVKSKIAAFALMS
jgi:fructose-bisphosphate aldolase class II